MLCPLSLSCLRSKLLREHLQGLVGLCHLQPCMKDNLDNGSRTKVTEGTGSEPANLQSLVGLQGQSSLPSLLSFLLGHWNSTFKEGCSSELVSKTFFCFLLSFFFNIVHIVETDVYTMWPVPISLSPMGTTA